MPTWSTELPPLGKHMGFDLRRTPATGACQAIITCDNLLVCDTHFYHGRTTPCERPNCPACNETIPYRTHVYVSAFDARSREHFIFECTANAAKPLAEYYQAAGTLRGCIFHASRPKGLKNSKVFIQTNSANLAKNPIPEPPDLVRAISVIWRLPTTGLAVTQEPFAPPQLTTVPQPLNRMREQPDNQPDPQHISHILAPNGHSKRAAKTV